MLPKSLGHFRIPGFYYKFHGDPLSARLADGPCPGAIPAAQSMRRGRPSVFLHETENTAASSRRIPGFRLYYNPIQHLNVTPGTKIPCCPAVGKRNPRTHTGAVFRQNTRTAKHRCPGRQDIVKKQNFSAG